MKYIALFLLVLLTGCGGGSNSAPPPPYPGRLSAAPGQWVQYGTGTGQIGGLSNSFSIPAQSSGHTVNYVYTAPPGNMVGKTITLTYSVDGGGTLAPLPESGCGGSCGPAILRLFIWGNTSNTSSDRWWCSNAATLMGGDNQKLSCVVTATQWTGTGIPGQSGDVTGAASNAFAAGFTFGGMFAGHGVWVTSGAATFTINSFTVQ